MNPRLFRHVFLVLALFVVAGCDKRAPASANTPVVSAVAQAGDTTTTIPKASRALIVTVDMKLTVTDVMDASSTIRREAENEGGYVSSSSASGTREDASASMDLRVPADKVAALRTKLTDVGEITFQSEKVDDVTEQRADLDARLHNARTEEARFLEIMQQKTGSIFDVINAEKELARVRETIELLEAQKRTLEGQIALATIHVTLTTPTTAAWQTPASSVSSAFSAGLKTAEAIAVYGAMAIAAIGPTLLPFAMLAAVLLVVVRRRRRAVAA
jgi:hypothetical protein